MPLASAARFLPQAVDAAAFPRHRGNATRCWASGIPEALRRAGGHTAGYDERRFGWRCESGGSIASQRASAHLLSLAQRMLPPFVKDLCVLMQKLYCFNKRADKRISQANGQFLATTFGFRF